MPRLIQRVGRVLTGRQSSVHRECHHCGTTIETDTDACPRCGASELAHYHL